MPYVLVRHRVKDFAAWKPIFDAHGTTRRASGSKGGYLFRNAGDPHEMVVLLEWESLEKARAFAASQDLRDAMARAGVADKPDIYFLEQVARPSA